MDPIKKTCKICNKEFWVIKQEQEFLQKKSLPFPDNCPGCREQRRLSDRGERQLYKTTCKNCKKEIVVTYDPEKETRQILCRTCYLDWFEKNPVLIT